MTIEEITETLSYFKVKYSNNNTCIIELPCNIHEGVEIMNYVYDLLQQYKRLGVTSGKP